MMAQLKPLHILIVLVWMIFTVAAHPPGTSILPSESLEAESLASISPNLLFPGNNYAMVCMQEKQFTDYCQRWGGYYCSSSGKLKTTLSNNEEKDFCEGYCECKNLFPKPNNCILGIAGSLHCRRDMGDDTSEAYIDPRIDLKPENLEIEEDGDDRFTGSSLVPRLTHNYALVCAEQKELTFHCQSKYGVYCTANGVLSSTLGKLHDMCVTYCQCVNLFPSPNRCFMGLSGAAYCARQADSQVDGGKSPAPPLDIAGAKTEDASIIKSGQAASDPNLTNDLEHWNEYALTCAHNKELTVHCQEENGVYCSAVGALMSTSKSSDDSCHEHCKCVNLLRKPDGCFFGISGSVYQARSLDQIKDSDAMPFHHRSQELDIFVAQGYHDTPNCLRTRDGEATCIPSDFEWSTMDDSDRDFDCNSGSAELVARYEAFSQAANPHVAGHNLFEREDQWNPYKKGEYLMIYGRDDRYLTIKCQRAGYYCDWQAKLKRRYPTPNAGCEGVCECRDLNPKPLCYMMLGAIMCGRSLETTERLLNTSISNIPQDSDLVAKDIEAFNAWGGVNNYAMNCFDSSFATKICLDKGYYCDSSGRLVFKGTGKIDKACDKDWCQCINLYPVPKCYLAAAGVLRCKRSDGWTVDLPITDVSMDDYHSFQMRNEDVDIEERSATIDVAPVPDEASSPNSHSLQNLAKRHNYAMVCWENSQMTALCNEAGYFCNKNGRLQHKSDSKDDPDCAESGVCLCVDLFPQPKCFWQSSGFLCARDAIPQIAATDSSASLAALELRSMPEERKVEKIVKRHNYAMNCWDSSVMTSLCAAQGYYCNSKGEFVLQKGRKGNKDCTDDVPCVCTDLFPKPKCFLQGSGVLRCVTRRNMEPSQLEVPRFIQKDLDLAERDKIVDENPIDVLEHTDARILLPVRSVS